MNLTAAAYLSSSTLSVLGNSIAAIALPLIVLQTTGSVLGAGVVAASTAIPAVLAGLFMGVLIDRISRRTSSVVADLISAASIAALPIVDMLTGLGLGWFVLFGIIGSLGDVPGLTARDAMLPAVVRHSRMDAERIVGIRESLGAIAMVVGPAAAGTLMALFSGPTVLWITAATSLGAALTTLLIPRHVGAISMPDAAAPAASTTRWSQLSEGWRVLLRSRFLRTVTMLSLAMVVVFSALQGLVLPVYFTALDKPGLLGFVMSALASGMLIGSGVYAAVGVRVRRRTWFVTGMVGMTVGMIVVATLAGLWVVLIGALLLGLACGFFSSVVGVLMIERVPESMRGRVMGTQNALTAAAPGAGILFAAALTEYVGFSTTAITLVSFWILVVAFAARSLRTLDDRPEVSSESEVLSA